MVAATLPVPATTTKAESLSAQQLWQRALARLQLQTSPAHFATYLRETVGLDYDAGASLLRVTATNPFHIAWLDGRFSAPVHAAVAEVAGAQLRVEFLAERSSSEFRENPRPRPPAPLPMDAILAAPDIAPVSSGAPRGGQGARLNRRYTFDAFVVGKSNQLAHAASMAVAEEPGRAYNPLFLYGGVGLGKTHLLHAVGHAVLDRGLRAVYVTSETFTNDLIDSIRQHRMDDFRARYREASLLLVDDVQFIAGKERTEEEFFHTFNAIHDAGGQIILSSDRPPKAMMILEDRLRSRFQWGLIADVQPPDLETRIAILQSKLVGQSASAVPSQVVHLIAERVQSNIRELEGALNRLMAQARHLQQPITLDLASAVLRDLDAPSTHARAALPEAVLQGISRYYGVGREDLVGKARHKTVVVPRQLAMYLLREDAGMSTPDIGRLLNRDHTTVLHGAHLVAGDIARNGPSRSAVRGVREILAATGAA